MTKKITDLTELTTPAGGDLVPIVDVSDPGTGTTKKIQYANLSGQKAFGVQVFDSLTMITTGDGKVYTPPMPTTLNGYNLSSVIATVFTPSTSGTPTIQIARGRQASPTSAHAFNDMLSTRITIDVDEYCSLAAATQPVINTSYDDITTGDILRFDVDVAGSASYGLWVSLVFTLP